jgi:hypothetical protein
MRSFPLGRMRRAGWVGTLFVALACLAPTVASALPDGRGWELVSPAAKNGGEIAGPGGVAAGGVFQAAADGSAVTYSSASSFAAGAQSAPPGSQYLSARGAGGWSTESLDVPIFSGSFGADPDGVPYQLFSTDLVRGLLLNGRPCRSQEGGCPVANPPLTGTDAPAGYQDYYLRQGGGFEALIGAADVANTALDPAGFGVRLAGASPDLGHVVLESCAALTPAATEIPLGAGCDPDRQNLYAWSAATGLSLVNTDPGATLGAQAGAISANGGRVYFIDLDDSNLYLREGATTKQADLAAGGGGSFETASADGGVAFLTKAGHLWRYLAAADTAADLTPAGGVVGVLGASDDGSSVYYLGAGGLYLWHAGATTKVAAAADPGNYPPATGTARVSADGSKLAFVSSASLTGYDNTDQKTGLPDSEVFLYDATANALRCVSCRPNGARPIGPSSIPGAYANGSAAAATAAYKARVLSADGKRLFFDSTDALVGADVNREPDVYEWQPLGAACPKAAGCIEPLSSGRSEGGARFVDASLTGDDVFFVTDGSLVGSDPGSFDLYDARVGGGFPEPLAPIPCLGDACQDLPSEPVDPALNTAVTGPGNPKVRYFKYRRKSEKPRCRGAKCKKPGKGKGAKRGKRNGGRR